MKKQHLALAGLVGAALLLPLALWQTPARAAQATPARASALAVETIRIQPRIWPQTLALSGGIYAWQEASISAETGGLRITALHADVGTVVRKGQVLAELFADSIQTDIRQNEAGLKQARVALGAARSDLDRARAVADSGALSAQKIEQYAQALQTAEADVAAAEAKLAASRITLGHTRITASDDGIITKRSAQLGQVVASGTELFTLQRQQRLEWRAEVDASQLSSIKPGMQATLQLPDGKTASGRVRQLAPALDSSNRLALAYIDLAGNSSARAGMYASGQLNLGQQLAYTVPASAVTVRDGRQYVFELQAGNLVRQREVKVGRRQGNEVELLGKTDRNVALVKSGGGFLNDGDSVRVSQGGAQR